MKHHYAASYPYGIACNKAGHLIRTIHRFPSAAARDAWVEAGNPYRTSPDHRQAMASRQAAPDIRRQAATAPRGVPVWVGNDNGGEVLV